VRGRSVHPLYQNKTKRKKVIENKQAKSGGKKGKQHTQGVFVFLIPYRPVGKRERKSLATARKRAVQDQKKRAGRRNMVAQRGSGGGGGKVG